MTLDNGTTLGEFKIVDGIRGGAFPGDGPQRLKKAERHERGEDVRLDPVVQLVVDGPEAEVVLQLSERPGPSARGSRSCRTSPPAAG